MSLFTALMITGAIKNPADGPIEGSRGVFIYSSGQIVSSGMSFASVYVSQGHTLAVYSSGVVDSADEHRYGFVEVYDGGSIGAFTRTSQAAGVASVTNLVVNSGGYVSSAYFSYNTPAVTISGAGLIGSMTLLSNTASAKEVQIGQLTQSTYGGLSAFAGAVVSSAIISANHFRVLSGATALNVFMYSGGNAYVSAGGSIVNIVESGGQFNVYNYVGSLHLSSGKTLIYNGGTICALTMDGGELTISSGASALNVTSNGGTITVRAGGYIEYAAPADPVFGETGVFLANMGGTQTLGWVVTSTALQAEDTLYVYSGGTAISPHTEQFLTTIDVNYGGVVSSAVVNQMDAEMVVRSGGTAISPNLAGRGHLTVLTGGTALNVSCNDSSTQVQAQEGAIVTY